MRLFKPANDQLKISPGNTSVHSTSRTVFRSFSKKDSDEPNRNFVNGWGLVKRKKSKT